MSLDVRPFGDRAVLVQPVGALDRMAIRTWVLAVAHRAAARWPQAEVTPGLASVLIAWPGAAPQSDEVHRLLGAVTAEDRLVAGPAGAGAGVEHVVEVRYDGPDLAEVARSLGLAPAELVARHTGQAWSVTALGFAPGFAYLTSSDDLFDRVPRRADPRPAVARGSLAVAAGMCAVYPSASPGGWQLLGSTDVAMFDVARVPPARLRVGDTVTFVAVSG